MKSAKSTKGVHYEERIGHEEQEEHEERLYARLPDIALKPKQAFAYAVNQDEEGERRSGCGVTG